MKGYRALRRWRVYHYIGDVTVKWPVSFMALKRRVIIGH